MSRSPASRAAAAAVGGAVALAVLAPPAASTPTPTFTPTGMLPATSVRAADGTDPGPVPEKAEQARREGRPVGGDALGRPGVLVDAPAGVPAPPALDAGGYVVAEIDSGKIVLAKNAHATSLPASTIKALTALVVVPRVPPETVFTAEHEDAAVDGTKVGLQPGLQYTVGQCLQAMILASANDCAVALARVNGGKAATTQQMNSTLRSLGALDSAARNTSGLDAVGQVASAYDLALVGRAAVRHPGVAPYLTIKSTTFPAGKPPPGQARGTYAIGSHNRLLWNYDGSIGVKNGYTIKARHTYIGAARRGDKAYVIAYLNSSTGNWRSQAALLDWAFAHGDAVNELGRLVDPADDGRDSGDGDADTGVAAAQAERVPGRAVDAGRGDPTATPVQVAGGVAAALVLAVLVLRARVRLRRRARRARRAR